MDLASGVENAAEGAVLGKSKLTDFLVAGCSAGLSAGLNPPNEGCVAAGLAASVVVGLVGFKLKVGAGAVCGCVAGCVCGLGISAGLLKEKEGFGASAGGFVAGGWPNEKVDLAGCCAAGCG